MAQEALTEQMTPEEVEQVKGLRAQHSFLGHPKGIGTLSFMQLCNSFSNYCMSSILIYYLYTSVTEGGLGLTETDAAQLVALYSGAVLLAGLVGSFVADRVLGPRKALRFGRIVMAVAYVALAIPALGIVGYAASQFLLVFAAMLNGRSLDALTGMMYDIDDGRRDGAYSITYVISNIGAAVPAIAGTVALVFGYSAAFMLAAVSAVIGVVIYLLTEKKFFGPIGLRPDDPLPDDKKRTFMIGLVTIVIVVVAVLGGLLATGVLTVNTFSNAVSTVAIFIPLVYLAYIIKSRKSSPVESKHVLWIVPLFIATVYTSVVWTQSTTILAIYADTTVDRTLFGMEFSPAVFQTLPAILAVIFGAVATALWTALGKHQPSNPAKIAIGTVLYSFGPVFMTIPFMLFPAGVKVSPLWLCMFYVLIIAGEALVSPTGYSSASIVAPKAFATQMLTVWSLCGSTGAGLSTLAVNFYHEGAEVPYFLFIGGIGIVIGLICLVFSRKIAKGMGLDRSGAAEA